MIGELLPLKTNRLDINFKKCEVCIIKIDGIFLFED